MDQFTNEADIMICTDIYLIKLVTLIVETSLQISETVDSPTVPDDAPPEAKPVGLTVLFAVRPLPGFIRLKVFLSMQCSPQISC